LGAYKRGNRGLAHGPDFRVKSEGNASRAGCLSPFSERHPNVRRSGSVFVCLRRLYLCATGRTRPVPLRESRNTGGVPPVAPVGYRRLGRDPAIRSWVTTQPTARPVPLRNPQNTGGVPPVPPAAKHWWSATSATRREWFADVPRFRTSWPVNDHHGRASAERVNQSDNILMINIIWRKPPPTPQTLHDSRVTKQFPQIREFFFRLAWNSHKE